MNKKSDKTGLIIVILFVAIFLISKMGSGTVSNNKNTFKLISSTSTKVMEDDLKKYAKSKGINLDIEYMGDLEIIDTLNSDSKNYNAVWISNSIWLYMLDNPYLVTDSKSIALDPVVMGITKSKAESLGFIDKEIYNEDILDAIKEEKLKYVMASVTKTNTGATAYLNFLNSLAGSPLVLTKDILEEESLKDDLKDFFSGVERVSGDEEYLTTMFKKGNYDAMINYESSLINLNKELVKNKKEPLYIIYPVDGVAINDMPLAYINNDSKDTETKEKFKVLQEYLRSNEVIDKLEKNGFRSWYGGINEKVDKNVFNPDWGIDTKKYLNDMKYPSKDVMTQALNLYIESLRKPTHVVFCLDVSGSMYGDGLKELKDSMNYILDYNSSSKDLIQFSDNDKITVITFNGRIEKIYDTKLGNETEKVIDSINELEASGGTNIYAPSIEALKILKKDNNDYTKTVVLMTDGQSNGGSFRELKSYYNSNKLDIPIYSITFGNSSEDELEDIASLTNAKVFDGKSGLKKAFIEVRSYN